MWKIVSNQLGLIRNAIGQFVIVTQPIRAKLCINYSDSRDWASWLTHTPYCFQRHRFVHVCWFPDVFLTMTEINAADSIRTFIFASLATTFGSLLAQGYSKRKDLENFTDFFQRGGLFSVSRFHMIVILENISSCRSQSPAASEKHKCTAIKPFRDWVLVFFITVQDKVCISKWNKWCFYSQQIHSKAYVSIRWCHRGPPAHQEGWPFGLEYLVQGQFGIRCPWLGLSNRRFDRCKKKKKNALSPEPQPLPVMPK